MKRSFRWTLNGKKLNIAVLWFIGLIGPTVLRIFSHNDVIERSMLVLKLMSYYNGAVLVVLTTSLPESVGEVRNWDYRFCWLRDASMSIQTLFQIGHIGAARRFMKFIQSTFVSKHESYQIMYGIRGEGS